MLASITKPYLSSDNGVRRPGIELPENWIFIGDSLTEGVGSKRASFVTELLNLMRTKRREGSLRGNFRANFIRLNRADPTSQSRFVVFNLAGFIDKDADTDG